MVEAVQLQVKVLQEVLVVLAVAEMVEMLQVMVYLELLVEAAVEAVEMSNR